MFQVVSKGLYDRVLCFLILLAACCLGSAQARAALVKGSVRDRTGAVVTDARIILEAPDGRRETVADASGQFEFTGLTLGRFTLRAEAPGYRSVSQSDFAEIDTVMEVDLRLDADRPLGGPFQLHEKVEVTATRSTVGTEKSPASSTVVLRRDMERRNIITIDQALTTVEGVYAWRQRGVPDNEVGIGMRGFSGRGTGQNRVLVLLDGVPVNNAYTGAVNWTSLPLSEVDRIEVARGPFSSLWGGNAMGGVVNVITRPIGVRTAEVATQYGRYGTANYSARAGSRFGERLGLSFGFDGLRTDGYRAQEVLRPATVSTPTGGIQVSGIQPFLTRTGGVNYGVGMRGPNTYERYALRGRAEYAFNSRTFGSFQYFRTGNEFGWGPYESWVRTADGRLLDSGAVVFQEGGAWRRITLTPSNFLGVVGGGVANLYQGQLLAGSEERGQWRFQGGINEFPREWSGTPGGAAGGSGGAGTETVQSNRGGFFNAQWNHTVRARHALVAGVDVRRDRASIAVFPTTQFLGGGTLAARSTFSRGTAATWALYAQDQFALSDRLTITFGGRYDAWRTYRGQSQAADGAPTTEFPDRTAGAVTGKVAALLALGRGAVARASVGTAFRSPTVFDLYRDLRLASGTLLLGNPNVDPERMRSWEFGIRQELAGRRLFADVAYYENHIRDLIFRSLDLAADPSGLTQRMLNAGRARTRGVETALTARPLSWLTFRPTYTFTHPLIVRNDLSPQTVGKQIPFVARHVSGGTLTAAFRRLTFTGTGRYQTAVFALDTNADTTKGVPGAYDGFLEIDSSLNFALTPQVGVWLVAENMLNRQYYLFYRNPGRTIAVGFRFRWQGDR